MTDVANQLLIALRDRFLALSRQLGEETAEFEREEFEKNMAHAARIGGCQPGFDLIH